jgi:diguanylate cyclase (GGDEF)-like protein
MSGEGPFAARVGADPHRGRGRPRQWLPLGPIDRGIRQAAVLFTCIGLISLISDALPGSADAGHPLAILLDVANLAVGVVSWFLPWNRWPSSAGLVLPLLALVNYAFQDVAGAVPSITVGIWFVVVFVWVGSWNPQKAVFALAPFAAAAYLAPFAFGVPHPALTVASVLVIVPVAVLVGVALARKNSADEKRRVAEHGLRALLEEAPVVFFAFDTEGIMKVVGSGGPLSRRPGNPDRRLGLVTAQETEGKSVYEVFAGHPDSIDRVRRSLAGEELSGPIEVSGQLLQVCYRPTYDANRVQTGVVVVGYDTTEQVKALAEARRLALTDELTGLANRRQLYEHFESAAGPGASALLVVDLERFKAVNDALGQPAGDELLRQFGPRIAGELGAGCLLARLSGDEFAVMVPGDLDNGVATANRIIESLALPFLISEVSLHVDVRIGIAAAPLHAGSLPDLLRCAGVAKAGAKDSQDRVMVYTRTGDTMGKQRLLSIEQLRGAIRREELTCYFQPKLDLLSGQVTGAEALVRWPHPERGILVPDQFLSLAQEAGLMRGLTSCVLERALSECQQWHRAGYDLNVAVNLAVSNLLDTSLPATVKTLLDFFQLPASSLTLEVTEDAVMADPFRAEAIMGQLRELGVVLSVDDYGTGYSSLAYLRNLPVRELKLDRSFVTDLASSPTDQAIVKATVALAGSLGLKLVAEGVESQADLDEVTRLGVDIAQGYWISRPLPNDRFTEWLRRRAAQLTKAVLPVSSR